MFPAFFCFFDALTYELDFIYDQLRVSYGV